MTALREKLIKIGTKWPTTCGRSQHRHYTLLPSLCHGRIRRRPALAELSILPNHRGLGRIWRVPIGPVNASDPPRAVMLSRTGRFC